MLCKDCRKQEAVPCYHGLCSKCRTHRYYHRGMKCIDCGIDICSKAIRCRPCSQKQPSKKRKIVPGRTNGSRGYVTAFNLSRKKSTPIHIQIGEAVLGRRLRKSEVIHHVSCDRSDNRNSNLLICGRGYHRWLHEQMARAWAREHLKEGC